MSAKSMMFRAPLVGPIALTAARLKVASGYFKQPFKEMLRWLVRSREITNFTYDLDPLNRRYLATFLAHVTGTDQNRILEYFCEIEEDAAFQEHIATLTKKASHRHLADPLARFGRRIGWYAVVRALKPRIVVETGVDKGLGACVLTSALQRNEREGYPGYYYGTDRDRRAGYLLSGQYARYGEVLYGDSIESLRQLDRTIDVFINDSDHSAQYESDEYQTIRDKLSADAIVLGDNAHVTNALIDFAQATGRNFLFFQEKPRDHWYPGAGIGAAFPQSTPEAKPIAQHGDSEAESTVMESEVSEPLRSQQHHVDQARGEPEVLDRATHSA